jgi:hypothetical protein
MSNNSHAHTEQYLLASVIFLEYVSWTHYNLILENKEERSDGTSYIAKNETENHPPRKLQQIQED